jgi:translation initiation factor 1
MNESKLVYSTETGRMCPKCGRPQSKCVCQRKPSKKAAGKASDGLIRVRRESKGRKGKTVTTISGFQEKDSVLRMIASNLKNRCGTGGSYKDGIIIIQGDHRETVKAELTQQGFTVKIAGG